MESEQWISNLDYLRRDNELVEYVEQFYFFLAKAVQEENAKIIDHLLTHYVREVLYVDNRVRLHQLLQAAEPFMSRPENRLYQALFYMTKGNVRHFALDFDKSLEHYRKAISIAAETYDFHVLAVTLNNLIGIADNEQFEHGDRLQLAFTPSILLGMTNGQYSRKQYMLLIVPLEIAIDLQQFDYAQQLLNAVREQLTDEGLILRELCQLDLLQLRIYVKSGQYDIFFEKLDELAESGFAFQYDLQLVMYDYALEAANAIGDAAFVAKYTNLSEQSTQKRVDMLSEMRYQQYKQDKLLQSMVPFERIQKEVNQQIAYGELPMYSVVIIHVEQQQLTDDEVKVLHAAIHDAMLPNVQKSLFGCTKVSDSKLLYVLTITEDAILTYLSENVKPIIVDYRERLQKQFRVMISYVQNDLYDYTTFEQTLQHAYALVYYERYQHEQALLNT